MFCPRCGAQNKAEQKYCRQCGLSLSAVKLALEGTVDEVAVTIEKDFDRLTSGVMALVIFMVVALVSGFFSSVNAAINLILGFLIAGPLIYRGIKRVQGSIRSMVAREESQKRVKELARHETPDLSNVTSTWQLSVRDTDPLRASQLPNPVTEHPTFDLKTPLAGS
ncbi:MAG TPA: zinc-ribbon domain-containing protein [Blastocatellia bacterium]|nr:zinc-ribbon domain-containing protein [Blastocatellia bacterium]